MEVTFDDIARTLNASRVSLPGDPTTALGYTHPSSPAGPYRYQPQRLPGDFGHMALGGSPGPPLPPHPHHYPHPHARPDYGRPPPPPPPPGSYRGPVPPIPPSLLTGPRNIERQLA